MTNMDAFINSDNSIEYTINKSFLNEPRSLYIYMTRGERYIHESINKAFGKFEYVIIDVDGEKHKYDADTLIELLEHLEIYNN